jgi:hypothetical protein
VHYSSQKLAIVFSNLCEAKRIQFSIPFTRFDSTRQVSAHGGTGRRPGAAVLLS